MPGSPVLRFGLTLLVLSLALGCSDDDDDDPRPLPETVDPVVSIDSPTSATTWSTGSGPIAIGGTASDNVGVDTVLWSNEDTGATGTATGTETWTASVPLDPGPNLITVTALDAAQNSATDSILVTLTTGGGDTTPPSITIDTPTPDPTYLTGSGPIPLAGTASDNVGVTAVNWSNAATGSSGLATGTTTWSATVPLSPGLNVITVSADDGAGNTGTDTITVTLDTSPPTIAIETPTAGGVYSTATTPILLAGTALDDVALATVSWSNGGTGGGGTASGTNSWLASVPLATGPNAITMTAGDGAGNTGTDTITVTLDFTPPTIAIDTPTSGPVHTTTGSPVIIGGTAGDNVGVTAVTWSNSATASSGTATGTDIWNINIALTPGANPLTATAVDGAGNTGTDTILVTLDAAPPVVTITSPTMGGSYALTCTPLDLAGTASDDGAISLVSWQNLDTGQTGIAIGTDPWSASVPVSLGMNLVVVTALDGAGRTGTDLLDVSVTLGGLEGWGRNQEGQLGLGNATSFELLPATAPNFEGVTAFSAGAEHTVVARCDGTAWAAGYNGNGQLGDGTTLDSPDFVQVTDPGDPSGFLQGVVAVAATAEHTLAVLLDGTVRAWGFNDRGELGDGTLLPSDVPVQVIDPSSSSGFLENVTAVDGGSPLIPQISGPGYSMALLGDGTVRAWGYNNDGILGDGTMTNSPVPLQVVDPGDVSGYLQGVTAVAAGTSHAVALLQDGTVRTWGANSFGQLGDPAAPDPSLAPVQVLDGTEPSGFLNRVVGISAGSDFTLAVLEDGTVKAWGRNNEGQLGDNSTVDSPAPIRVLDLTDPTGFLRDIVAVSAGGEGIPRFFAHGLALKRDGTVWAWGYNGSGQLGDGTQQRRLTAVPVEDPGDPTGFLTGVSAISAGGDFSMGRK